MVDVRKLRVLRELATVRSFSEAARGLGYTQSAISQHIRALERETGLQLVERGTRPITLTEAARLLLVTAEPIFGHLARTEAAVAELAGIHTPRIRLAAFASACSTILAPALAAMRNAQPDVEISLVEAEPQDAARALKAGSVDLAVGYAYPGLSEREDRALEHRGLFDDPLRLVLPRDHALLDRRRLTLADLAGEAWIVPPGTGPSFEYRRMLAATCRAAGFEPRIAFEMEDIRAGQALVAAGLGVALIPELALEPTSRRVEIRVLTAAPVRRILATRLRGPEPVGTADAMLQAVEAAARSYSPSDKGR